MVPRTELRDTRIPLLCRTIMRFQNICLWAGCASLVRCDRIRTYERSNGRVFGQASMSYPALLRPRMDGSVDLHSARPEDFRCISAGLTAQFVRIVRQTTNHMPQFV